MSSSYVYGVVRAEHPDPEGLLGIADEPVRLVRVGALAAAVSAAPAPLVGRRRELLAHSQVVEELWSTGPILPMRFGTVVPDESALQNDVLADPDGRLDRRLEELRGRAEVTVKVWHNEDTVLREIVLKDRDIAAMQARVRRSGTYSDRIRLGELVAQAVQRRAEQDGDRLLGEFAPMALDARPGALVDGTLLNVAFLLDVEGVEGFVGAVTERVDGDERLKLRIAGPLPPYSFVDADEPDQVGAGRAAAGDGARSSRSRSESTRRSEALQRSEATRRSEAARSDGARVGTARRRRS